tara:strand:- start:12113 stop:12226 length:114 start_codon:yes stop_codon:yes gene_type:complete
MDINKLNKCLAEMDSLSKVSVENDKLRLELIMTGGLS